MYDRIFNKINQNLPIYDRIFNKINQSLPMYDRIVNNINQSLRIYDWSFDDIYQMYDYYFYYINKVLQIYDNVFVASSPICKLITLVLITPTKVGNFHGMSVSAEFPKVDFKIGRLHLGNNLIIITQTELISGETTRYEYCLQKTSILPLTQKELT